MYVSDVGGADVATPVVAMYVRLAGRYLTVLSIRMKASSRFASPGL